jgi:sirohydrochlorin cobaltochelatase
VHPHDFADAALVLLGHGTALDPEAAVPVVQHAAELRRRNLFAEVREAFWKQEPQITQVLSAIDRPRIFIVPLFISEGYFSGNLIPRALGFPVERGDDSCRIRRSGPQTIVYCRPIGTHDRMSELLLARAREVLEKFPFPRKAQPDQVTLILAGHGTSQDENSRKTIERQVALLRAQGPYDAVHAVFLEEAPRISACYEMAPTKNIAVVPFFISEGPHVRQDIPIQLGESEHLVRQRLQNGEPPWRNPTERHGKLVWYAPSVGTDPRLADLILDQVRQAAPAPTP